MPWSSQRSVESLVERSVEATKALDDELEEEEAILAARSVGVSTLASSSTSSTSSSSSGIAKEAEEVEEVAVVDATQEAFNTITEFDKQEKAKAILKYSTLIRNFQRAFRDVSDNMTTNLTVLLGQARNSKNQTLPWHTSISTLNSSQIRFSLVDWPVNESATVKKRKRGGRN